MDIKCRTLGISHATKYIVHYTKIIENVILPWLAMLTEVQDDVKQANNDNFTQAAYKMLGVVF